MLSLSHDMSTIFNHYNNIRESCGALKRAKAAKVKFEIKKGMALVDAWMSEHCQVVTVPSLGHDNVDLKWQEFAPAAKRKILPGKMAHVSVADLTKNDRRRLTDSALDEVLSKICQVSMIDPLHFIGIIICPIATPSKVLRGERGMRAKLETKLENRGFVPFLFAGGQI